MAGNEKMITVDVGPDGKTKIEAHGFEDNTCLAATKSIEEALGVASGQKLKPEGLKSPDIDQKLSLGYK